MNPQEHGPRPLIDTTFIKLQLVEAGDGKKFKIRGEFAKADVATENGRVYPGHIWEREITRLRHAMSERKVLGELDHPSDGKTLLQRASHLLTGLELKNGILIGEAEALDTKNGQELQALLKSGVKIGVSSRGFGSTKQNTEGKDVVQEDYKLATFDFVADPADGDAYPDHFYESKEPKMDPKDALKLQEEHNAKIEEAVAANEAKLRKEFTENLANVVGKAKAELREEIRGELLTDPSVAGARTAIEKVKSVLRPYILPEDVEGVVREKEKEISSLKKTVAERDLTIKGLEEDVEKLSSVAKEAAYKLHLERLIGNDPEVELIRQLVGDVNLFESSDALTAKIDESRKHLEEKRAAREEEDKKLEEQRKLDQTEMEQLRDENLKLLEATEKALEANKRMGLLLYAEKQLTGNPNAVKIRKILESAKLDNTDDVDGIIEDNSTASSGGRGDSDLDEVRARIRKRTRGGRGYSALEEERGEHVQTRQRGKDGDNYNGLGVSLGSLQRLSGMNAGG